MNPSGVNKIRVGLDASAYEPFRQFLPGAVEKAADVYAEFSFSAKGSAITRIVILMYEVNMGSAANVSIVEGKLMDNLVSNQFKIIDKSAVYNAVSKQEAAQAAQSRVTPEAVTQALHKVADVLIIGNVEAKESEGGSFNPYATSYQSNRKSAWAGGLVRCIDLETGKIIATSEKQGVKGQQLSLEKAGVVALQKLGKSVSADILAGLNESLR